VCTHRSERACVRYMLTCVCMYSIIRKGVLCIVVTIQEARTISLVSPFTACIVYDYVSIYQE
jgi:hypothetical protein